MKTSLAALIMKPLQHYDAYELAGNDRLHLSDAGGGGNHTGMHRQFSDTKILQIFFLSLLQEEAAALTDFSRSTTGQALYTNDSEARFVMLSPALS